MRNIQPQSFPQNRESRIKRNIFSTIVTYKDSPDGVREKASDPGNAEEAESICCAYSQFKEKGSLLGETNLLCILIQYVGHMI